MEPEKLSMMLDEQVEVDPPQASSEGLSDGQINEEVGEEAGNIIRQLFPEEIWEKILGEVKDPLDLWSCYNTCPLFKKNWCPNVEGLLRRYHSQLRRVHIQGPIWDQVGKHLEWTHLSKLHLDRCSTKEFPALLSEVVMPNLMKLGLELGSQLMGAPIQEFATVIQIISELSTTTRLTTLRLNGAEMPWMNVAQRTPTALCMPPTLKTLELDYKESPSRPGSFYFLVYFPHLENLNVYRQTTHGGGNTDIALLPMNALDGFNTFCLPLTHHRHQEEKKRQVQVLEKVVEVSKYLFTGEMYKSKIWEVLPRLKVFTFQWEVYTRGGYEDYCRKRSRGKAT